MPSLTKMDLLSSRLITLMLTVLAIKNNFGNQILLLLFASKTVCFSMYFRIGSFIRSFFLCDNEIIAIYFLLGKQL